MEAGQTVDLGDNVEFTIQTREGKEVACNITKLLLGTVVFEDVGSEYFRGQVLKPLDRNYRGMSEGDALSGRVKYRGMYENREKLHLISRILLKFNYFYQAQKLVKSM